MRFLLVVLALVVACDWRAQDPETLRGRIVSASKATDDALAPAFSDSCSVDLGDGVRAVVSVYVLDPARLATETTLRRAVCVKAIHLKGNTYLGESTDARMVVLDSRERLDISASTIDINLDALHEEPILRSWTMTVWPREGKTWATAKDFESGLDVVWSPTR